MLASTQQSISDLNEWKKYFSAIKSYFQTYGLNKKEVEDLYEVKNDRLPNLGIKIAEYDDIRLRSILSSFNQDQNYRSNPDDHKFIVDLITVTLENINISQQQEQNPSQERFAGMRRNPKVPMEQRISVEERLIAIGSISIDIIYQYFEEQARYLTTRIG